MINDLLASLDEVLNTTTPRHGDPLDGGLGAAPTPAGDPIRESSAAPRRGPDTETAPEQPQRKGPGGARPGSGPKKRIFEETVYVWFRTTPQVREAINDFRRRTGMPGRAFCEQALRFMEAAYPPGTRYVKPAPDPAGDPLRESSPDPLRGPDTKVARTPSGDPIQPVRRGRGRPRKYPKPEPDPADGATILLKI